MGGGRGALAFEIGYHPRKKIHVIRVVFQDRAMYPRTSFRGAKTCKIGKKGVFLVIVTNFGKDMMDKLRKTHAKCVFRAGGVLNFELGTDVRPEVSTTTL